MLPLIGTTVVSLEQAVAAPFATRQLADLGARVIKIERPVVGDFARGYDRSVHGDSSYFVWLNRGKESIELDLKNTDDLAFLNAIIDSADVFVQNLVPGAVDRLGLDARTLRGRNPSLIHCSISGYGSEGPYKSKKAYDLLIQCETGMLAVTGTPDEYAKTGVSIADIATGMYAYSGVLTALLGRSQTNTGATIEVAMLDALGEWMVQPAYYSVYGDRPTARTGARHASIAPYGPYKVGDGSLVFLGVQSDREWAVLCRDVIDRAGLVDDERFVTNTDRVENNDAITPLIEAAFSSMSAEEVVDRLESIGIACARLRSPAEFFHHPQLAARDRWRNIRTPRGEALALLPPVAMNGLEPKMGDVPALGQHNEALRSEFVLDADRAKRS